MDEWENKRRDVAGASLIVYSYISTPERDVHDVVYIWFGAKVTSRHGKKTTIVYSTSTVQ